MLTLKHSCDSGVPNPALTSNNRKKYQNTDSPLPSLTAFRVSAQGHEDCPYTECITCSKSDRAGEIGKVVICFQREETFTCQLQIWFLN